MAGAERRPVGDRWVSEGEDLEEFADLEDVEDPEVDEDEPASWCEDCEELVEPEDMDEDGTCPKCGAGLVVPPRRRVPWYFKGMLVATVIYLGYRAYQGITWIAHHA